MKPTTRLSPSLAVIAIIAAGMLAGCPAQAPFIVADVSANAAPVANALVAANCDGTLEGARAARTDERGRAAVPLNADADASRCVVTVARDGYQTIERRGATACTSTGGCPRTSYELHPAGGGR